VTNDSTGLTDVIAAPADKIIEALTDFDTFPQWQNAVLECEVLERNDEGRGSLVRMKVDAKVRKVDYVVRYTYDLPRALSWEQVSGDLKENTGRYTFAPREDGSTDVTVDIVAEVGFFVPGPMKKLIREQSLKNSLRELNKRVAV
jgi:uncharacterized membrane protein